MQTMFAALMNREWPHPDARGYLRQWWSPPVYHGPLTAPPGACFHYTTAQGWRQIEARGILLPQREYAEQPVPLLWCTREPIYCFGAFKPGLEPPALRPGEAFGRIVARQGPLYRVVLPASAAPLTYRAVIANDPRHRAHYHFIFADLLLRAIDQHPWRCSATAIPAPLWRRVEVWCPVRCTWVEVQAQTAD